MLRFVALLLASVFALLSNLPRAACEETFHEYGRRMVGGTWHMKVPEGDTSQHTYHWALGQKFLKFHGTGGRLANTFSIIGIDPSNDLQTWWNFRADGSFEKFSLIEKEQTGESRILKLQDGKGNSLGTFTTTYVNDDRLEAEAQAKIGGKQVPETQVWERVEEASDISWLNSDSPTDIPSSTSLMNHLATPQWVEGERKPGENFVGACQGHWILDGKFFLYTGTSVNEEQEVLSHLFVAGQDPETGRVTGWEFASNGELGTFVMSEDGQSLKGEWVEGQGEEMRFSGDFQIRGNIIKYSANRQQEGQASESYYWTYRARPTESERTGEAKKPDAIPKRALVALRFFVGGWESETYLNGEKIGGDVDRRRWLPGRHAISMTTSGEENGKPIRSSGISGWDAKGNQLVERWYSSDGLSATIRYPLDAMQGKLWKGDFTVTFGDGKTSDGSCEIKMIDEGFEWTAKWVQDGDEMARRSITRKLGS